VAVADGETLVLRDIAVRLTTGAFRFVTGHSEKTAYKITTPLAPIGGYEALPYEIRMEINRSAEQLMDSYLETFRLGQAQRLFHAPQPGLLFHHFGQDDHLRRGAGEVVQRPAAAAQRVAVPGCHASAFILAIHPLVAAGIAASTTKVKALPGQVRARLPSTNASSAERSFNKAFI